MTVPRAFETTPSVRGAWLIFVLAMACGGPDLSGLEPDLEIDDSENNAVAKSMPAQRWLPLSEGNWWRLESKSGTRTVRVLVVDGPRALIGGLLPQDTWFGIANAQSQALHRWTGSTWEPMIRFGLTRSVWVPAGKPCVDSLATRATNASTTVTPLSSFSDTATILFSTSGAGCALGDVTGLTFAPDIGLVGLTTNRGEQFGITAGSLEGQPIVGTGVTATLELNEARYRHPPAGLAKAQVVFSIKNESSSQRTFRFTNSCPLEVELSTLSGRVVKRATQDLKCTAGTVELPLPPGETHDFAVEVVLADGEGLPLIGSFTATARLNLVRGTTGPSAALPFAVEAQQ